MAILGILFSKFLKLKVTTTKILDYFIGEIEFYRKTIMITFDDGQYEDYYLVYPIIKRYTFNQAFLHPKGLLHIKKII